MVAASYPLRFFESHRVTIPEGGKFFCDGRLVCEDDTSTVLRSLKSPRVLARAKATSSGVLINGRTYPGTRMKNSVHHFTKDHGKPVLDRHPDHRNRADSPKRVGRVVAAEYVQTFTDKAWRDDFKHPRPNGHPGSGHILMDTMIAGQENVERVLDKRDLTLSVGFTPMAYYCSVCGVDWIQNGGPCGHEPMKVYEIDDARKQGRFLCFGITGDLIYDHIANVNFPADPTAQFLSTTFQDAAGDMATLLSQPAEAYHGQLAAFALVDEADNRALELQLEVPEPSPPETWRNDEAQVRIAVDIPIDVSDPAKEDPMDNKPAVAVAAKNVDPNRDGDAAAAGAGTTTDKPAGEGQDFFGGPTATTGAWTMPDPVDGHTHGVAKLDENLGGETTAAMGTNIPDHTHVIKNGRVMPSSGGEGDEQYTSRHPNTFFLDEDGKPRMKPLTDQDDTEGGRATDEEPDGADMDACGSFSDDEGEFRDFLMSDADDVVTELGKDELTDIIEDQEFVSANKLTDAALTAAQRKKIPSRLFCGPNRTWPVPDKPRVRNALARLGQGLPKGASSATKAKILACVKRRAKTLGVSVGDGSSKSSADSVLRDGPDQTILKTLGQDLEARNARISQLEGALSERDEELTREKKAHEDAQQENLGLLIDRVLDMKIMLGKPDVIEIKSKDDLQKARDEHAKRSVDSLRDTARDLQLELAQGGVTGARVSPDMAPPESGVGALGGAPASKAGVDETLADATLRKFRE